jgi:hypothetical protein
MALVVTQIKVIIFEHMWIFEIARYSAFLEIVSLDNAIKVAGYFLQAYFQEHSFFLNQGRIARQGSIVILFCSFFIYFFGKMLSFEVISLWFI